MAQQSTSLQQVGTACERPRINARWTLLKSPGAWLAVPCLVLPLSANAAQAIAEAERLLILQTELAQETAKAGAAAEKKSHAHTKGDPLAIEQATQTLRRAEDNVAALRREIARSRPIDQRPSPPGSGASRPPRARTDAPPAWWDVYARSPMGSPATPAHRATHP
jgi:hypothetical protein